MYKNTRSLLFIAVLCALLLSLLPVAAFAGDDGKPGQDVSYRQAFVIKKDNKSLVTSVELKDVHGKCQFTAYNGGLLSAKIWIGGTQVVRGKDFSESSEVKAFLYIEKGSVMSLDLRGLPGSAVKIMIDCKGGPDR